MAANAISTTQCNAPAAELARPAGGDASQLDVKPEVRGETKRASRCLSLGRRIRRRRTTETRGHLLNNEDKCDSAPLDMFHELGVGVGLEAFYA